MSLSTKVIKYAGNVTIAIPDGNAALNGDADQPPTFTIGIFSGHIAKKMVDSPGTTRYKEGTMSIIPASTVSGGEHGPIARHTKSRRIQCPSSPK